MDAKHDRHASLIGAHIRRGRQMRGMSQRALALKVGVSATAISKYENGRMMPTSRVLGAFCAALDVRVEALVRPPVVTRITPVIYRLREKVGRKELSRIHAQARDWVERYLIIEDILSESPDSFSWHNELGYPTYCPDDVEAAAAALRKEWGLGDGPIANVTAVLELNGIKVDTVATESGFEGCSFYADTERGASCPVIVIAERACGDRQRFALAHELAHLWLDVGDDLDMEETASHFAAAFLVPRATAVRELGAKRSHGASLDELHTLKHLYGMSMQAWVHRARELGIIGGRAYQDMKAAVTPDGNHVVEPGRPYPPEAPMRFERLVRRAHSEGIIGDGRASELLGVPLRRFVESSILHDGVTAADALRC